MSAIREEQRGLVMRRAGVKIIDRIKRNPIPLAMAGVGLWLFFRSSGGDSEIESQRTASVKARAKAKASDAIDSAREKASELASLASGKTERVRAIAWHKMQGARDEAWDVFQRQPLVGGLVAFAVGAVVAAIIPETEREDALLGDARDRLFDRATELARERAGRVKEAAREEGQEVASGEAGS